MLLSNMAYLDNSTYEKNNVPPRDARKILKKTIFLSVKYKYNIIYAYTRG